ncbi:alpha/beta hydrolase [Yinghuangia sp. ASG 101]|uniref:alpha/beta fold hydrolase n=1 Tax=Yinghuangia sp. ASG 101 TaxID=2896848 RepID=UPI001E4C6CF4|nr:alpha/beta fold hydrolase [Yinghuangia sp. ASG 101]UGQ11861.1 alpha/beta hydrolase [Yinghuangia sp. ASG 101]
MFRTTKMSAAIAVCCAVAGVGLVGCSDSSDDDAKSPSSPPAQAAETFTGTQKFDIEGHAVNVSCTGTAAPGKPVIMLMPGHGDGLEAMAALQTALSQSDRVCAYDRLGEGASDKPDGPQDFASSGKILTGVLDKVVGSTPVVLAGHSMGGLIAARYAPDHQDRVKGLVLMDATSPTAGADIVAGIPESATGDAAGLRAETISIYQGENNERLVVADGEVRSAGDIPVEVLQHGKQYFVEAVPEYGQALEQGWTAGQNKWLGVSTRSTLTTATNSGHYIYVDEPDLALQAIRRVTQAAAG